MKEYYLFLDDLRSPGDVTWVNLPSASYRVARNYNQFVENVCNLGLPVFVSFDHDLADEHYIKMMQGELHDYGDEKTGYECAQWLVDYCVKHNLKFPAYAVHSLNPVGRERIDNYIRNAIKHLNI